VATQDIEYMCLKACSMSITAVTIRCIDIYRSYWLEANKPHPFWIMVLLFYCGM